MFGFTTGCRASYTLPLPTSICRIARAPICRSFESRRLRYQKQSFYLLQYNTHSLLFSTEVHLQEAAIPFSIFTRNTVLLNTMEVMVISLTLKSNFLFGSVNLLMGIISSHTIIALKTALLQISLCHELRITLKKYDVNDAKRKII